MHPLLRGLSLEIDGYKPNNSNLFTSAFSAFNAPEPAKELSKKRSISDDESRPEDENANKIFKKIKVNGNSSENLLIFEEKNEIYFKEKFLSEQKLRQELERELIDYKNSYHHALAQNEVLLIEKKQALTDIGDLTISNLILTRTNDEFHQKHDQILNKQNNNELYQKIECLENSNANLIEERKGLNFRIQELIEATDKLQAEKKDYENYLKILAEQIQTISNTL